MVWVFLLVCVVSLRCIELACTKNLTYICLTNDVIGLFADNLV